jgi:GntR family transcriptional regulator/MocR family aminotransferase
VATTGDPGLILGFGGVPEAGIIRGVQTLAEVLATARHKKGKLAGR